MILNPGSPYKHNADLVISNSPLRYIGVQEYQNETYYAFFDVITGLIHWLNPDVVRDW